ncbi:UDP-glucuronosyltransferase 2B1 [Cephus cinctus]|uniref:UDP-glucuronosyltransferase 2B1 n=1 Tax=Cephus cinctus TaxID=211228 RepID=A0AAJ7BZ52_CEPCN|nr:UDP-glucuronosyltransferase 2B1 [Cephus cinctus]
MKKMSKSVEIVGLLVYIFTFLCLADASSLASPPKSALVIAFDNVNELSLLANTLSDQGIDTTLVVNSLEEVYDNLVDVEVYPLNKSSLDQNGHQSADRVALQICQTFLTDEKLANKVREILPTFVVFPAWRHDACLLPWVKHVGSIPVIWSRGIDDELYTFQKTEMALPIHRDGIWSRLIELMRARSILSSTDDSYVFPALKLVQKFLPDLHIKPETLYSDVTLVFWGADYVLRSDFALLSRSLVEIGCHHCRGVYPLPPTLQKELIEFRLGTVAALLDENYEDLIVELAEKLPQGRQGQAIVWKRKNLKLNNQEQPANLFIHSDVIRQDIIGFARTRVLLSHCEDTVLLEAAFHGTPVICFPRNHDERRNSDRAIELGFSFANVDGNIPAKSEPISRVIKHIHETASYRENARKISQAIRDRPNPATDRILYWLDYVLRNREEPLLSSSTGNRDKNDRRQRHIEDFLFGVGLVIGAIIGLLVGLGISFLLAKIYPSGSRNQSHGTRRKFKT